MFQILDEKGNVRPELEPELEEKDLVRFYQYMLISRIADEKAFALQREGRMGTYPQLKGHEAIQIGSAMALKEEDWMFPVYRDLGAMMIRGVPLYLIYLYWMGFEVGSCFPEGVKVFPFTVPVGSQISIGMGHAWAAKLKGEKRVNLVSFGDGATSEGDFHDGLNFAGVFKAPAVFLCNNNQWAISVPLDRQTSSPTIAQKALAYGFKGIRVDGNDILAMHVATKEALGKARDGGGPTLIEAYTYRMSDHTTADDASRYRTEEEVKEWEAKDPIHRFKIYLQSKNIWNEELEAEIRKEGTEIVADAVKRSEEAAPPTPEEIFKFTYKEMTPQLEEQLEELQRAIDSR